MNTLYTLNLYNVICQLYLIKKKTQWSGCTPALNQCEFVNLIGQLRKIAIGNLINFVHTGTENFQLKVE